MLSKITGGQTTLLFTATILNKYKVSYFQCNETGFVQTEEPYWLDEAYSSVITKLDIGLLGRNINLSNELEKILSKNFNSDGKFLDYGGGYGVFTRLMRDKGFDFYNTDRYCDNLFAEFFDLKDIDTDTRFEMVTAFEVMEHLPNPYAELETVLKYSDSFLFSTELLPNPTPKSVNDWWYFIPETGQHVSIFTEAALTYMAKKLGYNFYTDGQRWHLFTKKELRTNPFKIRDPFFIRKMRKFLRKHDKQVYNLRETLLQRDWEMIKSKLS